LCTVYVIHTRAFNKPVRWILESLGVWTLSIVRNYSAECYALSSVLFRSTSTVYIQGCLVSIQLVCVYDSDSVNCLLKQWAGSVTWKEDPRLGRIPTVPIEILPGPAQSLQASVGVVSDNTGVHARHLNTHSDPAPDHCECILRYWRLG
jgi:hypothetical protein